ncbi:MAG: hypothetical protein LBM75_06285 [Myxococcales bacterium]|jgi:hypothetical protein|nr:hypothetical protein [Myxococcales bacterium]
MGRKSAELKKTKLILAEGADEMYWLIHLIDALKIEEIQVLDFGGNDDLRSYLEALILNRDFKKVTSILIARDSETSTESAIKSVNESLRKVELIHRDIEPFEFVPFEKRVGFVLFPGYLDPEQKKICSSGTLEDLCLRILDSESKTAQNHVAGYLEDFSSKQKTQFSRIHKNRFHSYISFTDKFVGMKVGETMKAGNQGLYDLNSPYLKPFIDIIREM